MQRFSHVVAFDDRPFERSHRGDVGVIGAVFAGLRLDGVLSGRVRRDGANAARTMADMIARSNSSRICSSSCCGESRWPASTPSRHERHPRGARKWRILKRLGPMEKCEGVYVQRVGLTLEQCAAIVKRFAVNGREPEPLRVAHLIASAQTAIL